MRNKARHLKVTSFACAHHSQREAQHFRRARTPKFQPRIFFFFFFSFQVCRHNSCSTGVLLMCVCVCLGRLAGRYWPEDGRVSLAIRGRGMYVCFCIRKPTPQRNTASLSPPHSLSSYPSHFPKCFSLFFSISGLFQASQKLLLILLFLHKF